MRTVWKKRTEPYDLTAIYEQTSIYYPHYPYLKKIIRNSNVAYTISVVYMQSLSSWH